VYSRRCFPDLDVGHSNLWTEDLQSGRRGGAPRRVAQHGLWNVVIVYVHCQRSGGWRSGGWRSGGWLGMMQERMDMRGEERTRNALQLKGRLEVLRSHGGQVWNEKLMVRPGGCPRYD
jgi:hypothetical protein